MEEKQLTPWFPPSIIPARHGVYETRWVAAGRRPNFPQYQYWNGTFWGGWGVDMDMALSNQNGPSARQEPQWRGLSEQPK